MKNKDELLSSGELFELYVQDAVSKTISGWDFSYINDRLVEGPLSWSYSSKILPLIRNVDSLLDMGTGGGEFLSSLAPLPKFSYATEAYKPNLPVAKKRLAPLGVDVVQIDEFETLPFEDDKFEIIINRHEWYSPQDVFRILKPEGFFITQQVGAINDSKLRLLLTGDEKRSKYEWWNLKYAVKELESSGFHVLEKYETITYTRIFDVGAIVFYLKAAPWEISDFTVQKYHDKLVEIHHKILEKGYLDLEENTQRFLIIAQKLD